MYRYVKPAVTCIIIIVFSVILCPDHCRAAIAKVNIIQSQEQYLAGSTCPVLFQITISNPWYIHGAKKTSDSIIPTVLSFSESPGVKLDDIQFPSPERKKFAYTKEEVEVYSGEIVVRARLKIAKNTPAGKNLIKGNLSYQACSSLVCMPPEQVPILFSLLISPQAGQENIPDHEVLSSNGIDQNLQKEVSGPKSVAGFLLTLLGIFLGGMALNLTPCIYPLIPVTVSYFGGKSKDLKGKILIHSLLYIAGLSFTNSLLGVTVSLSGGMLGSALQSPVVLIVIAGILVTLASSFFGLWELRIPLGLTRLASKNFGGYFGTFFMGLTLGIVAAPCLGPFILGLLTYVGQMGDPFLGFLYFFVLSIGLGLPLSVLAIFSGALRKLPLSGEWMLWIRKVFGWALIGMAVYLLLPLISGPLGKSALVSSVLIAAALHLGWFEKSRGDLVAFRYIKRGSGVILIGVALSLFYTGFQTKEGIQWIPYDHGLLIKAAGEHRPVMLDFYADWCAPCRAMEKNVLSDPEIISLSHKFVTIRVDLTKRHPHQEELQKRYKIRGVPTIIFLNSKGVEERALRIESLVSRSEVLNKMKKAAGAQVSDPNSQAHRAHP